MAGMLQSAVNRVYQEPEEVRGISRFSTLEEYLRNCHTHIAKVLRVEEDRRLCTNGSITGPMNKPCPTELKPWTEYPMVQQRFYERVCHLIPAQRKYFDSANQIRALGGEIRQRQVASEDDLKTYLSWAVEQPATNIISLLREFPATQAEFSLGDNVTLQRYVNQEVQLSSQQSDPKPRITYHHHCLYKEVDNTNLLHMIVEYRPPSKLSTYQLRAGLLRADRGSLHPINDVINRVTAPTDLEDWFVQHSERLVVAALTQLYGYMIVTGLEYSMLATAEAQVFLRLKQDEPHTLYYHLAEPTIEAEAQSLAAHSLCRTAVTQFLSFSLLALNSGAHSQAWRQSTWKRARRALIDDDAILRETPDEEAALIAPMSVLRARIHPLQEPSITLGSTETYEDWHPLQELSITQGSTETYEDWHPLQEPSITQGSTETYEDWHPLQEPSITLGSRETYEDLQRPSGVLPSSILFEDTSQLPYCTHACLLGLGRKLPLDEACPNMARHRKPKSGNHHPIDQIGLARALRRQLGRNPGDGCEPLGKQGSRGALFKLTLTEHGYSYTFVAKGTVEAFVSGIMDESRTYRCLSHLQGDLIPVYLGSISLPRGYLLDVGDQIVHLLLMSWAGERPPMNMISYRGLSVAEETDEGLKRLLSFKVYPRNRRRPNVLWDAQRQTVMLVDFVRPETARRRSNKRALKRKRLASDEGASA